MSCVVQIAPQIPDAVRAATQPARDGDMRGRGSERRRERGREEAQRSSEGRRRGTNAMRSEEERRRVADDG
jgi:hypothetical protein